MIEIERLVENVNRLRKKQETIESLRKSRFNIFRVLKLETNEPRTHSAFIGELLDPSGSHLMGNVFLDEFIKIVLDSDTFDIGNCSVALEKYIGAVTEDFLKGGRLDIVITNSKGYSITIENKIYATLQNKQLERYANYNSGKNKVLYLTLKSIDFEDTNSTSDVKNISYEEEILNWLQRCYLHSIDYPILRECIKQYIKLIERLVGKFDDDNMNKELQKIILENIEASRLIALNYDLALNQLRCNFQNDIANALEKVDLRDFIVVNGNSADRANAQIWIKPKHYIDKGLWFGIETFGTKGFFKGSLNIGIIAVNDHVSKENLLRTFTAENKKGYWYRVQEVKDIDNLSINFSDNLFVVKLAIDDNKRNDLIHSIVEQFKSYFDQYRDYVLDLVRS